MGSSHLKLGFAHALFAVLTMFSTFVNASLNRCEGELKNVQALVSLLEGSLRDGTLEVTELERSFATTPWINPFSLKPKSIQNLSSLRGFQRYSRRLTETQRQELRAQIPLIVARTQALTNTVNESKDKTADFISLRTEKILNAESKNGHAAVGTYKGRNILIHQMTYNGRSGYYRINFDLRGQSGDPKISFVTSGSSRQAFGPSEKGYIFQWHGRDYFADGLDSFAYDIETQKPEKFGAHELKDLSPKDSNTQILKSRIIPFGNVLRLFTVTETRQPSQPDFTGGLHYVDLGSPQDKVKTVFEDINTSPINLANVSSRQPLVAMASRLKAKTVRFFDLSENAPSEVSSIEIDDDRVEGNCSPLVFTHNGMHFALVLTSTRFNVSTLRLYDIRNKLLVESIDLGDFNPRDLVVMRFHEINGRPYAFLYSKNKFIVLDLATRRPLWSLDEELKSDAKPFRLQGQDLLLISTEDNGFQVRDLIGGNLRDRMPTPEGALSDAVPIMTEDGPMAWVVQGLARSPLVVKMTRRLSDP